MNRIKELRIEKNLTQKELSDLLGIGQSTLSEIENGKYLPRIDLAKKIAKILNHDLEKVFPEEYEHEKV
ncbi:helix-turn-helix transcriptional regulator [Marinitoga lauensis]|uniref:helix-turn-helix transcriptional regulator n=1 Tax=Marinitoga lauensis TaxID=2201189 RepID=UPI0010101603|nr:helix-turn-helix transcriptional regulator [Marinitoga lauensis]